MNPKISIITIVYNGLPFLKECIESVLVQNHSDWELLISDDGSNDGSREYIDSLDDTRIRVFKQEKNLGIFGNLNFLFKNAKSEISQILCQDDYFTSPDALKTILEYWDSASENVGFVRFNHLNERTRNLVSYEKSVVPKLIKAGEADFWLFVFGNIPGNLSNVSLKTEIVEKCGWFDQKLPFAGDFEFWCRAARLYDMGVEGKLVTHVRKHDKQASVYLNFNGELFAQKIKVVNEIYSNIKIVTQFKSRFKLHGTLNYDSLQRDIAIKSLIKGNTNYMKEINKWADSALYVDGTFNRWIIYFFSLGGRIGRISSAKKLVKIYNNTNY